MLWIWLAAAVLALLYFRKESPAQNQRIKKRSGSPAQTSGSWRLEVLDGSNCTFCGAEDSYPNRSEAEKEAKKKLLLSWRLGKRKSFLLVAPDGEKYVYIPNFPSAIGKKRCLICDKEGEGSEEICPKCQINICL